MSAREASPSQSSGDAGVGTIVALLGDRATTRMRQLLATYYLGSQVARVGWKWYKKARDEATYTVKVRGDDSIYGDLHAWLLERTPPKRRRSVLAQTKRVSEECTPEPSGGFVAPANVRLLYDGSRSQIVDIGGHRVRVAVEVPGVDQNRTVQELERLGQWVLASQKIVFSTRTVEARDAVLLLLADIASNTEKRTPKLRVATSWGSWMSRSDVPTRPLESVVLRPGQKERLIADLELFLSQEADYVRLGVPWHRGYLLEGPPGSGKTSLAKAVAGVFNLDVYYLPLPALEDDGVLIRLLAEVEPRSMLVIEDIDIMHSARKRDDTQKGVTMAGLLNALDGFITPHGLITFMMTNRIEVLDEALIRAGRADVTLHVGQLDDPQLADLMFALVGERRPLPAITTDGLSPSDVVERIKRHIGDPSGAFHAVRELITAKETAC